jgi:hypothetical protein
VADVEPDDFVLFVRNLFIGFVLWVMAGGGKLEARG